MIHSFIHFSFRNEWKPQGENDWNLTIIDSHMLFFWQITSQHGRVLLLNSQNYLSHKGILQINTERMYKFQYFET